MPYQAKLTGRAIRAVFQVLYFSINVFVFFYFFSVSPAFIVLKHRQHLDSSGDEGCLDEDDKITSGYRSGMQLHDQDPCHLLKGILFYTVVQ